MPPLASLLCIAALLRLASSIKDEKILLKDVQVLTFQDGQYTTGRRSKPLPQIQCDSGCGQFFPSQIQCQNSNKLSISSFSLCPHSHVAVGSDGTDVNWKCDANLPTGMRFSQIAVGCEGSALFDFLSLSHALG
jgi:hypothetical protein